MARWIYSTDARDIGILYLLISAFSGMLGTTLSMFMRLQLMDIEQSSVLNMPNQMYNVLITVHALLMIFYLIMPSLFGGFGNEKVTSKICSNSKEEILSNNILGPYLSGLIEGDGSIYVPNKKYYNNKNKKIYPKIQIVFNKNDLKLVEHLMKITNIGKIYNNNSNYIWSIQNIKDIIKIVFIINGYMRTPKILDLNKLIIWLNENDNKLNIQTYDIDKSAIDSNSWLAGLIDVDGKFIINILERKNTSNLRSQLYFRLEMKQISKWNIKEKNNTLFYILTDICNFLCTNLLSKNRKTKYSESNFTFIVISHSIKSHSILINYLNKYQLYSSKYNNYISWLKIYNLILEKKHLTLSGQKYISDFNKTRTTYNWDHLKNLSLKK